MDNIFIWLGILVTSIIFSTFHYNAGYNKDIGKENKYYKFLEWWRHFVNYFIGGIIAYYFVRVRWIDLSQGKSLLTGDFVLGAVFLMAVLGWLPYFVKNITEGINVIFERFFGK